jgi:predicted membrane protein
MTSAGLASGEHLLSVSTVFGSVAILLPREGAYSAATSTVFGGVEIEQQKRGGMLADLRVESPDFRTAPQRIRIRTSAVFGQIKIWRG